MNILKNRTMIGVLCIVVSLIICLGVTPLYNRALHQKETIVRVRKEIKTGDLITKDMVEETEVGGYNLPEQVIRNQDTVLGKYAVADLSPGDYIINTKVSESPAKDDVYLYQLNGEKQAISVSVKAFANGLSGKLKSGDIVSVIAPDYKMQGSTVIPAELQFVEVIAVTANSGYDANTGEQTLDDEKELPGTVTLLATPEQCKILASLEADGRLHLSLVYRGDRTVAEQFLNAQDACLEELYAPIEEPEETEIGETEAEEEAEPEETESEISEEEQAGNEVE